MDDDTFTTPPIRASETPAAENDAPTRNFAPLPSLRPVRQPAWRRALAGLVAVAAVIALVAGITGALSLTGHLRGVRATASARGASATQTAQSQRGQAGPAQPQIAGIAFTSPNDGWIAFNQTDGGGVFYHYVDGKLTKAFTVPNVGFTSMTLWPLAPNNMWALLSGGGGAYHYDGSHWTRQRFPAPPNSEGVNGPFAMTMISPTQGWAVGDTFIWYLGAQILTQVFYHYDGSAWRIDPADSQASAGTPGGSATPTPSNSQFYSSDQIQLTGISATPSGDAWATGYIQTQDQNGDPSTTTGYIYHRVNGVWRLAQTLPRYELDGIQMTGPASGWIMGKTVERKKVITTVPLTVTSEAAVVLGWNGSRWSPAAIPQPPQSQPSLTFSQIAASSPSNVWICAISNGSSYTINSPYASDNGYLLHYDGARWSSVSLPQIPFINPAHDPTTVNTVSFSYISPTPSGDLWIAGALWAQNQGQSGRSYYLLYHYVHGQWREVPTPNP